MPTDVATMTLTPHETDQAEEALRRAGLLRVSTTSTNRGAEIASALAKVAPRWGFRARGCCNQGPGLG